MKNILLVTMSLDIGGAETHFIELARALKKRGYNVVCASRGGSYVSVLEGEDIPHYVVPLASKHPRSIIKAYKLLSGIVKDRQIELIHAHARIPAAICHMLCKRRNIVLVTTVHGAYSTGFALKHVTRWGQKTLAVSEDLKQYLLHNYKVDTRDITLTINGINSDIFTPRDDCADAYGEFGVPRSGRNITYLGRINSDTGEYAFRLIALAPKILSYHPDANIVVIGAGDRFEKLSRLCDEINASLERKAVFLLGARTDVDRLLQPADLVVGVSRAALEAMSCKKRVLLASDFGYMGLFDESKLDDCIKNNFTCRGFEKPSDDVFLSDILYALSESEDEKNSAADFGRALVVKNYSVDRMAADAIEVYESVKGRSYGKKYDFLILGYYGFNNSGDDALLDSVIHSLLGIQPGLMMCVLSNLPSKLKSELSVDSFHRFNIISVLRAISRSEVLVYGGGNLIQDVTSTKSLIYYASVLFFAQILGTKTMLYSNGIGPVNKPFNRRIVRSVLNNVDVITLREKISLDFLREIDVTKPKIYLTADITLTISPPDPSDTMRLLLEEGIAPDEKFICVSVRNWPQNPPDFEEQLALALDTLSARYGYTTLFLPLHLPFDKEISKRVADFMKSRTMILNSTYNAQSLIGIMSRSELTAGMRLHSLIFGAAASSKICGIVYDEKVRGFLDSIRVKELINIEDFNAEDFLSISEAALSKKFPPYDASSPDSPKSLALKNSNYAIELLKRKKY